MSLQVLLFQNHQLFTCQSFLLHSSMSFLITSIFTVCFATTSQTEIILYLLRSLPNMQSYIVYQRCSCPNILLPLDANIRCARKNINTCKGTVDIGIADGIVMSTIYCGTEVKTRPGSPKWQVEYVWTRVASAYNQERCLFRFPAPEIRLWLNSPLILAGA